MPIRPRTDSSSDRLESSAALEFLDAIARRSSEGAVEPPARAIVEQIDRLCLGLEDPAWPADLVARPCAASASAWHWSQLRRLLEAGDPAPAAIARCAFHARWITTICDPAAVDRKPLVSMVIPVYNRARLVCEAIESALAQIYRPIEVIVIDDGSTDDLEPALEPYREGIRFERQPNRGVASARNRGVRLARGDYLHFLDSDNLLDADAVERWIAACRCVGDAELCFNAVRLGGAGADELPRYLQPPDGGVDCPTTDLMRTVSQRHAFTMAGVLTARWLVLETGGFDERLRRGEDTRYWFRLGLRGTKAIGLRSVRNEVRPSPSGLSMSPREDGERGRVHLLNAVDLIGEPVHWVHAPEVLRGMTKGNHWRWIGASDEPIALEARERLLAEVERVGRGLHGAGWSARPLLTLCLAAARSSERRIADLGRAAAFHRRFLEVTERALEAAPASGRADSSRWLPGTPEGPLRLETLLVLRLIAARRNELGAQWPDPPFWRDLDAAVAREEPSSTPDDVVGRASPSSAWRFHRDSLASCLQSCEHESLPRQRAAYHARWLLLLSGVGGGAAGRPLVSIVIPVHNRARLVVDAVGSCFAQSYQDLEVVVVDDGSSDDLAEALQPWSDRIHLLRQTNQGAACARNLGVREANGELIHFLDADDWLEPDTLERKIAALRCIPDAELVCNGARLVGDRSPFEGDRLAYLEPPAGGEGCSTNDLMSVVAHRYPFLTSTVLVARWVLLEIGLFDPSLRRGQDAELFYRLGLRGTKVIGIRSRSTTRRVDRDSLSFQPPSAADQAKVRAARLRDMMRAPARWQRYAHLPVRSLLKPEPWLALATGNDDSLEEVRVRLLADLEELGDGRLREGHSPAVLLERLLAGLDALPAASEMTAPSFYRQLRERVAKALAGAASRS